MVDLFCPGCRSSRQVSTCSPPYPLRGIGLQVGFCAADECKRPILETERREQRDLAGIILSMCACNSTNTFDAELALLDDRFTAPGELARLVLSRVGQRFQGNDAYAFAESTLRGWP